MADTKISALTAGTTPAAGDLLAADQGGVSKSLTVGQVRGASAVPTIVAVTAEFTSTGVPTATLPTGHTTNDILVLVLQSSNDSLIAAPAGYTQAGPQNGIGLGAVALANRLAIFWKRDGGAESAPAIPDTGDHTYGFMFAVRGCPTTGDPFLFGGNNFKLATSTAGAGPVSVTSVDNTLVADIFAGNVDNAAGQGSALANTDLTSVTQQFNDGTTDGTGGFLYLATGIKTTAGPVKASTVTWANTSSDLCTRLHFIPSDYVTDGPTARSAQVQIFLGSGQDLDDNWVKPTGAKSVFVQICDGGGSGSGGNTTTTAAGGGAGGGGGYDEAWYNADDLGSTILLHAGKGGAVGTALLQAGNVGVVSEFHKSGGGPLTAAYRIAGTAATAAASADGGNGGCGSGTGTVSPAVATTRIVLEGVVAGAALGKRGGAGGSGTTAPVGGSPAEWGGGGGESGADTDAATTSILNGSSQRGGGGGSSGRTNTNISGSGAGGGAAGVISAQGASGAQSTHLPYGGSGGVGGGSSVVTGGTGGFPGGGGGGGAGVAGGFGGRGGDGCIVVTTYF